MFNGIMRLGVSVARALLLTTGLVVASAAAAGPIEDLLPGHWLEVPNSRLSSVNPCPSDNCSYSGIEGQSGVIDDWNGGAFASGYGTLGGLVVWGGGHNGYLGNEVYVFDLGQLRWVRVSEPVPNPSCNYSQSELQDGSPCAPHTYDYVDYHPGTNSFIKLGSASDHVSGGSATGRVHLFSFDTNQWRRGAVKPDYTDHTGASSAYDPNRDVFWVLASSQERFGAYDPDANNGAGAWTEYYRPNLDIDMVSAIDPDRDLMVTIDARERRRTIVHDLKNPNQPFVTVNTTGNDRIEQNKGNGFEWDPAVKAFIGWAGGTSVYKLTPPTGDWRTEPWVWTEVPDAPTNTVTPTPPNANDTYSRFRYAPNVNAYVVVNRTSDNVFIYKLSSGGGTIPAPSVNLSASPSSVPENGSTTLSWATSNATSCSASGGWTGTKATSGSQSIGPLTATTTFVLDCQGAGGTTSDSATVQVTAPGRPNVELSADPGTVSAGGSSLLQWNATNADDCTASGGWTGSRPLSGSETVGPLNTTTVFDLECRGPGGATRRSVTVTVTGGGGGGGNPPPSPPPGDTGDSGGGALSPAWLLLLLAAWIAGPSIRRTSRRPA